MSTALESVLVETIKKATTTAETATQFVLEQAPEVVQQLVTWKIAANLASTLLDIVVIVILIKLVLSLVKIFNQSVRDGNPGPFFGIFFGSVGVIIIGLGIRVSIFTLLQLTIAPKIWLIEYAANLLQGNG